MQQDHLNRYTRQLRLRQFDHSSQSILLDSQALIMGLGGLGSPAALYLAAAGVGHLTLADPDNVDISNLHRQILYTEHDLGRKKTLSATERLSALNSDIQIDVLASPHDADALDTAIKAADIVLDCTDNFNSRFNINRACVTHQKPLVSAAAIRLEGQIAVFNDRPDSPCYACLYEDSSETTESCRDMGVLGPLVGIMGSLQAMEAIKLLTNIGESLSGYLLSFEAESMQWRKVRLPKDPQCPVCSKL